MYSNVPRELRQYKQWLCWRLEIREDGKDTKVPYCLKTGRKASVTNPKDWCTFEEIWQLNYPCKVAVTSDTPVSESGFSGIGFVFTKDDPFAGIDLDDTHGDEENYARQLKIYNDFASYSELSQSGNGIHIIVKGSTPSGRRRSCIEVYSTERYFAITGNVYGGRFEITEQQDNLTRLHAQMGSAAIVYAIEDKEQKETDEEIIRIATNAVNGEKFTSLHEGKWNELYTSQSEADFAYVDIIAYYTQNRTQIRRLFRESVLGQTPKDNYKHRGDRSAYVEYMVNKSFDRQLPWIDIEGLNIPTSEILIQPTGVEGFVELKSASKFTRIDFPPGLLGDIANYIFCNSPTPVKEIALAGAIGLMAGICGRAYNVSGTGLNQYVLILARTGAGKEAMSDGIAALMNAVIKNVPASYEFRGPGELVSAAGLIRCFERTPALFSIIGEFGMKLKMMGDVRSNHLSGVKRLLLQLFNKSGKGNIFDFTGYSDKQKNIAPLLAPAYTIIGESTPESFYSALNEQMVSDGLLPRFLIMEYKGLAPYYVPNSKIDPPFDLVTAVSSLAAICLGRQPQNQVQDVSLDQEAKELMDTFSKFATDKVNEGSTEAVAQLWNRAHIKALKYAALIAVGINQINPLITYDVAKHCTDLMYEEISNLIVKFEKGEIGQAVDGSSEVRQQQDLIRIIREFKTKSFEFWRTYKVPLNMYRDGLLPHSAIQRRLTGMISFRDDRLGATNAIQKQLRNLLDADAIQEIAKGQLKQQYGTIAKAYIITNPEFFKEG